MDKLPWTGLRDTRIVCVSQDSVVELDLSELLAKGSELAERLERLGRRVLEVAVASEAEGDRPEVDLALVPAVSPAPASSYTLPDGKIRKL
jgi:hypothetical protein